MVQCTLDYSPLRVFGNACYKWLQPYTNNKLETCTQQCIFIGYSLNYKGYKCLGIHTGCVFFLFCHVIFNESTFPSKLSISKPQPTSQSTIIFLQNDVYIKFHVLACFKPGSFSTLFILCPYHPPTNPISQPSLVLALSSLSFPLNTAVVPSALPSSTVSNFPTSLYPTVPTSHSHSYYSFYTSIIFSLFSSLCFPMYYLLFFCFFSYSTNYSFTNNSSKWCYSFSYPFWCPTMGGRV